MHGILEIRRSSEVGMYARIDEINKVRARIEQVAREQADSRRDKLGSNP